MRVAIYAEVIRSHIQRTPFVISHSLSYDDRPPVAGIIKGSVTFADGSRLHFKEFIRFTEQVVRLKYAYHYVSAAGHLIFRYDNALDPAARLSQVILTINICQAGFTTRRGPYWKKRCVKRRCV